MTHNTFSLAKLSIGAIVGMALMTPLHALHMEDQVTSTGSCPLKLDEGQLNQLYYQKKIKISDKLTRKIVEYTLSEGKLPSTWLRFKKAIGSNHLAGTPSVKRNDDGTSTITCQYEYKGLTGTHEFSLQFTQSYAPFEEMPNQE